MAAATRTMVYVMALTIMVLFMLEEVNGGDAARCFTTGPGGCMKPNCPCGKPSDCCGKKTCKHYFHPTMPGNCKNRNRDMKTELKTPRESLLELIQDEIDDEW